MINKGHSQQIIADNFINGLTHFFRTNDDVQSKIEECIESKSSKIARLFDDYRLASSNLKEPLDTITDELDAHFQQFTAKTYIVGLLRPIIDKVFNEDKTDLSSNAIQALGQDTYDKLALSLGKQALSQGFLSSILMWYSQTLQDHMILAGESEESNMLDIAPVLTQLRFEVIRQRITLNQFRSSKIIDNQWLGTNASLSIDLQEVKQDIDYALRELDEQDPLKKILLDIQNTHLNVDFSQLSFGDSNTYRYLAYHHLQQAYQAISAQYPTENLTLQSLLNKVLSHKLTHAIRLLNEHPEKMQEITSVLFAIKDPNDSIFTQQEYERLPKALHSKLESNQPDGILKELETFKDRIDPRAPSMLSFLFRSKVTAALFIIGAIIGFGLTFSGVFTPLGVGLLASLYLGLAVGTTTAATKEAVHYTYTKIKDNTASPSSTQIALSSLKNKANKSSAPVKTKPSDAVASDMPLSQQANAQQPKRPHEDTKDDNDQPPSVMGRP